MKSDRDAKQGFDAADADAVLAELAELPISTWSYREEGASTRHLGPTAQDFRAAFGLGRDDRAIDTVDASGVALAAIQALHRRVERLEQDNARLRAALAARGVE
jgi:endosialidase-like protein